jgi:hypothetical protein
MYDNLVNTIKTINKSKKIRCFFLGNTVKRESSSFYVTAIRENQKFIYAGIIIFNDFSAKKIAKIIDGKVDLLLIDTEKKVISKNIEQVVNIEKIIKETIKKTKIFAYKGNDLTVQAAETFINNYFLKDVRGIGGKKILILGSGNIGTKLGIKLVESGGNVFLYRRKIKILKNIINTINNIIPKGTVAKAKMIKNLNLSLNKFHIIIGATGGKSILTPNHVKSFKSDVIILDIGKGIFKKEALKLALNNNTNMYRLDVTPAYNAYLENINTTQQIHNFNLKGSLIHRNFKLVKRGILSDENSIVVDNVSAPKKIYGISDGYGSFKKMQKKKLKYLQKKIISKK